MLNQYSWIAFLLLFSTGSDDRGPVVKTASAVFDGHGHVSSVVFDPKGRMLAVICLDRRVKLWDVVNHTELPTLNTAQKKHEPWLIFSSYPQLPDVPGVVAFSPDGDKLARAEPCFFELWDFPPGNKPVWRFQHWRQIISIAFVPDGKTLISGDNCGQIELWDTNTGQATLKVPCTWVVH
jgi:WD40 repeat protein